MGGYVVPRWLLGSPHVYNHMPSTANVMSLFKTSVGNDRVIISGSLVSMEYPIINVWSALLVSTAG